MRRLTTLIVAMALAACSSSGGDDDDDSSGKPTSCDWIADRMGTYLMQWTERSGDCGPITETLGRLDNTTLPDGCELDAEDRLSNGDCTLERSYTCLVPSGQSVSVVAISTQQTEDGSVITGTGTFTLRDDANGAVVCLSTYELRATRQ